MRIAALVMDLRENYRWYSETTPRLPGGTAALMSGLAKLPGEEIHIISCVQQPMKSPEKLADNIWFHPLVVPKMGWLRTGYQGCIRAIRKKLKEIKPDVVHGTGTERECAISAIFSGFPNLVAIQGNMAELARMNHARIGSYGWLTGKLEDFILPRTSGVLCNSTYTEGLVKPRAKKTWLVPHALHLPFFDPPPVEGPAPCVILNVGVISPRKRQVELLDVAETLHRRGLKFEFHFLGYLHPNATEYIEKFKARIKPMEAAGYARYLGSVTDEELRRAYDSSGAMVHFPTEEAFSMAVVEGLGRGLKFFGSRLGGTIDAAKDVPGTELIAENDWAGLADAIEKWIREGHARPAGQAAVIRERYHPEVIARRHVEIYREVAEQ